VSPSTTPDHDSGGEAFAGSDVLPRHQRRNRCSSRSASVRYAPSSPASPFPLSVRYFGNVSSIGVSTERRPVIGPPRGGVVPSEHRCKRGVPAGATVWGSVGHSSGSASFGATGGVTKNLLCLTQLRQSNFESRFYSILSADRPISVARDCLLWLGYVLNHISLYIIRYRRENSRTPCLFPWSTHTIVRLSSA